jgi:ABC-type glycerol-3-phosphate transport system substrate-binding protein
MKKKLIRIAAILLLCSLITATVVSDNDTSGLTLADKYRAELDVELIDFDESFAVDYNYLDALADYRRNGYTSPSSEVAVTVGPESLTGPVDGSLPIAAGIGGRTAPALVWDTDAEYFEWSFTVPEDGLYELEVEYFGFADESSPIQRQLSIDGEVPFEEAYSVAFYRAWRDEGPVKVNNLGDEVRPRQIQDQIWQTKKVYDKLGLYAEPLLFFMKAGDHVLRMDFIDQAAAFGRITFTGKESIPVYDDTDGPGAAKSGAAVNEIVIQAETNVISKTDPTVRMESTGDPLTKPNVYGRRIMNYLGGRRWRKGGQAVTWSFEVPRSGYYKVAMRVLQNTGDGLPVFRKIEIDGEVRFQELLEHRIEYSREWRLEELTDEEGEPYVLHLDAGEHTITMTAVVGPYKELVKTLTADTLTLSTLIRKIIMITGVTPDQFYDYELDDKIPGLLGDLASVQRHMSSNIDILTGLSEKRPSITNHFARVEREMQEMIDNTDKIPRRLNEIKNSQNGLGGYLLQLQEQPLSVDWIAFNPPDKRVSARTSTFFHKMWATIYNFFVSFFKDYDSVGSVYLTDEEMKDEEATVLNVWFARGREWAETLKEMADEDFTERTGIVIDMNIIPSSQLTAGRINAIMLAIAAGRAPDVGLGVVGNSPVQFAIRDATVDLSQFPDYPEVTERFLKNILIPFQYQGGTYALPETMNFVVLFYRKDIIQELNIPVPETWDELYEKVLPVLYQNGMQFYYPPRFSPLLFQKGGSYYSDNGSKSGLDSAEAYQAFKEWTELYTSYGIPVVADFFNRMRTGEMPMGIHGYATYVRLSVAAPELFGRWGVAQVPGTRLPDGSIDRSVGGISDLSTSAGRGAGATTSGGVSDDLTGQAAMILNQSTNKEAAWEFLKWWTSDDIQFRFGREMEASIGVEARWNTANLKAFQDIPWKREDLQTIVNQWPWYEIAPVVLGGYFTGRHVMNAWNRVVLGDMLPRDSLELAVEDINIELRKKQEEYGVYNPLGGTD